MEYREILLAEDDPRDIELTLSALDAQNLANHVVVVQDGAAALDYLYRRGVFSDRNPGDPVVVLLDLKMPKMDGLEVLKTVKGDPELGHIPVVVLTSSREEKDILDSYKLGVNAYVVKPVEFESFADAVRRIGLFWILTNETPHGAT
ncbi:MAG: response regulator [Desulfobacteraceae bacterium]|nr:response regulator [Desulfobacteraceae bacterium]